MIVEYFKNIGETMTELINRFKIDYNITHNKISYAGRLDPLAFGFVIILTDEDIIKKKEYCNKNKEYECWIIKKIKTDTYDILGLPKLKEEIIEEEIKNEEYVQEYPPYSSYKVKCIINDEIKKIPLWMATKNNYTIIEKKVKNIKLFNFQILEEYYINKEDLLKIIHDRIKKIKPQTFRQSLILSEWNNINDIQYKIIKYKFLISSGGYIRYLGNKLGGCCFDIERKKFII